MDQKSRWKYSRFCRCSRVCEVWSRAETKNVIIGNRVIDLGVYGTDKRALEVLKEIQESVLRKKKLYEMPKE